MENKTSKYFKYAIGEIILVVIGILIALQINNWNENRKSKRIEKALYAKLLENLESDLTLIFNANNTYNMHEDIHYNLYKTSIGKATYDSTFHYGKFRWGVNFDPTFKDNYQNKVDAISNDIVREAVINYFQVEEKTERIVGFFEKLKADIVRPYITNNNLMKLSDVYKEKRYQEIDTRNSINYEALSKKLNTPEFKQILYELRIKISAGYQNLKELTAANKKLRKIIKSQIQK